MIMIISCRSCACEGACAVGQQMAKREKGKGKRGRPEFAESPFPFFLGVFVTREHARHNKSGITHRGKTRISH
jgi:hypothetical protein